MQRRTQRIGGIVALAGAGVLALGTVGIVRRNRAADQRWGAALAVADDLHAQREAEPSERPVLWGAGNDEDAWPHYRRALALVERWDASEVAAALRDGDAQARVALLARGGEALDLLARGAHATHAARRVDPARGFAHESLGLLHTRALTQLGELRATQLFEEGRQDEAVRALLDVLQLGGDLARGPLLIEEMIGVAVLSPDVLVDGVADGSLLALEAGAQARLAEGVATLSDGLSWRSSARETELVLFAHGLDRAFAGACGVPDDWLERAGGGARTRELAAAHVHATLDLHADLDRAFGGGPCALLARIERLPTQAEAAPNPFARLTWPALASSARARAFSLARFRLLAYALSGGDPPTDPWLSEWLRADEEEGRTRLWLDHGLFEGVEVFVGRPDPAGTSAR
ncbi:MAG: hypothetical protein AAF682_07865 [Planctomycetota bacterium]